MAERYTSIRQIADDLYDHPMLQDVPLERIVNYAVEFSRRMGVPQIFEEKVVDIEIHDHRGRIPCDYYSVIQVKSSACNRAFIAATDSFYYSSTGRGPLTYKIQGEYIFTSMPEGHIDFAYYALNVDSNGYPLIPDDSPYIAAIEAYIKKKRFAILFDQGKIPQNVYQSAQQDYAFAAAECKSQMTIPTVDEMEAISQMWNRLLPEHHLHASGFMNEGVEEFRKF